MTYFVGIDIAKYTHYASIIDSNGIIIEEPFPFDNSNDGFNYLLSKLNQLTLNDIVIGFESTAHYHLNLMNFLDNNGFKTIIINPILTKRFRNINIRNVKNDKVDSINIAMYLSLNYSKLLSCSCLNDLHVLCNDLHNLKQTKSKLYIQLTAALDVTFPELKAYFKGNLKSVAAHNLLKELNTPIEISSTRIDKLVRIISRGSKGFNRKRVETLKQLAKESIGINSLSYSIKIKMIINQIELIEQQILELLDVIINNEIVRNSVLLQIPGMGYLQAANIISVIDSINRFASARQVLAYAGLDPIIRQSGTFLARSTRMSKRGNTLLRYTLIWSAHNCVRNSKVLNEYYQKKRSEGKSHYNALGHCAKKLVNYRDV